MLALSTSYLSANNDIQKIIQNFLKAKTSVKIYDIKSQWKLLVENSKFLFTTYISFYLAKYTKTNYKSLQDLDDKQYYSLKQIYFVIKGVEKIDQNFIKKVKEKIERENKTFSITNWIFIKSLKNFISTTNSIHYKALEIKKIIDMMEKPIQTEFLKQIPFDEIYNSRPDSAEYIF